MAINRYDSASKEEKGTFTKLFKMLTAFLTLAATTVHHRELREDKRPKYIFALGKNNALAWTIEFQMAGEEVKRIILLVSKVTMKSDFGKALSKTFKEAKVAYGGIVVSIPVENQESIPTMLESIGTLIGASEELELDPKRTYFDPPTGWVEGVENAPPKKEKKAKAPKVEAEVETPAEEPKA
jgi:hypothetical protein